MDVGDGDWMGLDGEGTMDLGELDAEERGMYAAMVEGHYADALYLETAPPTPAEYAREAREAFRGRQDELEELEAGIRGRCELAAFRVAVGDRSYSNYREIYGAGSHRAALERRRVARESARRWLRGETDSLMDLMDVTDEISRVERPRPRP